MQKYDSNFLMTPEFLPRKVSGQCVGTWIPMIYRNPQSQLTWAHCGSAQTVDPQLGILHGTILGPLHVGDSCVAWSFVGPLAIRPEPVSVSWVGSLEPVLSMAGCLAQPWCKGQEVGLASTWYVMLWWLPWEALSLLNEDRGEWKEDGKEEVGSELWFVHKI